MKNSPLTKLVKFFKKETVLCIAALLSVISAFFVPPSAEYLEYMDWRVLALLLGLMLVVAGLQSIGLFRYLGLKLLERIRTTRQLCLLLVGLCFFSAMLITNDVALITFVPFAVMILGLAGQSRLLIPVVVLQTIAANLGSMLTPIGNPQNLYLYSTYSIPMGTFLLDMLPLTLLSMVLLIISVFLLPKAEISVTVPEKPAAPPKGKLILYLVLFLVALSCVIRLLSWPVMLVVLCLGMLIIDRKLFKAVDYFLLLTFMCFFLFIGNIERIPAVSELLQTFIQGRELILSILLSQFISNVPAAILLSGFTDAARPLLYGINIGGLGTLIASLASVISYRAYGESENAAKGTYIKTFTLYSLAFLAVLVAAAVLLLNFL
ncbi:MAG: citrate transporter [Acetatifactor sp.]|nr:citrate transporter [Acetatifactor sp.]